MRFLRPLRLVGLLATGATMALPARAEPSPQSCLAPQPGRYVVMGQGELRGEPLARLLQETWGVDGSIRGIRLERRGRAYLERRYSGHYRAISGCRVAIERDDGPADQPISRSQAVLDAAGRPRFSLGILPDLVVSSRWFRQSEGPCSAAQLDGTVLSMQQGLSAQGARWRLNAVVQREHWQNGRVSGIAISSYGPTLEEATYSGEISVEASCLASLRQRDSIGRPYNYRAIVLGDGGGYLYLQTDPDDLTIGWLERLREH